MSPYLPIRINPVLDLCKSDMHCCINIRWNQPDPGSALQNFICCLYIISCIKFPEGNCSITGSMRSNPDNCNPFYDFRTFTERSCHIRNCAHCKNIEWVIFFFQCLLNDKFYRLGISGSLFIQCSFLPQEDRNVHSHCLCNCPDFFKASLYGIRFSKVLCRDPFHNQFRTQ